MDNQLIVSKINEYLHLATKELSEWLNNLLHRVTKDWWQDCVIDNLSQSQQEIAEEKGFSKLEDLDLAALLRVTDKAWYDLRTVTFLKSTERQIVRDMIRVRNNWAHVSVNLLEKDVLLNDVDTILNFFELFIITNKYSQTLKEFKEQIEKSEFNQIYKEKIEDIETVPSLVLGEIKEKDRVFLTGEPNTKGMVFSISDVNGTKKYEVFVDGEIKTFYDGQIQKVESTSAYNWIDLATLQTNLTAYEINNPSAGNLYSLNAARIDFVPYQFRPALKLIKSDEPKILIADSVGVGKTIEAGIIVKELEARTELDNVLIICPKPLVAERKWELEMKRFDEDFVPIDGATLRQIILDTHRDEEWPTRFNKAIIPYSILDGRVFEGESSRKIHQYGLKDLNPAPHFDLVIIDEAHHIRNGSMEKEKAFAYKCVKYFCDHADAVIMLTATPLQTSDDDLFTLMNLLRPDLILDKDVFRLMSRPNEFVYKCSHAIRGAGEGWREQAITELKNIHSTQWGENVIVKNPIYSDVLRRLEKEDISREERVKLVSDVESLHSFNFMLNRTRRKDIQDFCIRRSYTVETSFTPQQAELHNELLRFEYEALSVLHDARSIPFMMSTLRRQAASCIFGLAPYIRNLITRRFNQMVDDPDVDLDEFDLDDKATNTLMALAHHVLELADLLPNDDPKFDSVLKVIDEKQKQDNNKIILFSTFRHTLEYLRNKLLSLHYRVGQIDGSVKDDDRRALRERFELDKNDPNAIDILLFTEVGSEGLDYQFCDTMINYDLPWNPMRIEQRIGRIDRRGQKSEAVNIYNIITADTVDADIYIRCLMRIGIFERSIGECEEVLGEIGSQIEQIAIDTSLTPDERKSKLEQMADNEIRKMQELTRLEDEERALFGFDLSNYTAAREIRDAESPWISPLCIQHLIERYLKDKLGEGQYILGSSDLKQLRLNKENRLALLNDFRTLSNIKSAQKRRWENFLKGSEPLHTITFVPEMASKERRAFFITPMHPLVKQAAKHFAISNVSYSHLEYYSEELPEGSFEFALYAWNYVGLQSMFKVVPICENPLVEIELINILQNGDSVSTPATLNANIISGLESKHIALWKNAKEKYVSDVKGIASYKLESISSNFRNRKRTLENKIRDTFDERLIKMYESMLKSATDEYQTKVEDINVRTLQADIHTALIANGVIDIKRG